MARRYYQIKPTGPQIYPQPIAANGVVGMLWSSKVRLGLSTGFVKLLRKLKF